MSLPEQVGVAGHHVLHVALRHPARLAAMGARLGETFDADLYNLAADAVVNEALLRAGHALPRPAVRVADLVEAGEDALASWDVDRLFAELRRSGSRGRRRDGEPSRRDLYAGPAGDTGDARAAEWKGHLTRALAAGRGAGRGIGRFAAALGDLPLSRVPWERRLRRLVARAVSEVPRRSHRRPANAWIAMEAAARASDGLAPVFQPGLARDRMRPRIAVGLDTSSSIDDDTFARFAGEACGIARRTGAELHVLAFDETVHATRRLEPWEGARALLATPLRRGGGTAFVDVIATAARLHASVAVILTDLDGPFGPAPTMPVVWAVPDGDHPAPPFGTVLSLMD
jgi:predicted metal-dependent peptidase